MPALLRATTPNPCEFCKYAINKRPDKNNTMCATCYHRTDYVKTVGHDIGEKHCPRCGENKDENEFGPDKTKRDGKASTCRSCKRRVPKTPAPTQMIPAPPPKKNRGNSVYEKLPSQIEKDNKLKKLATDNETDFGIKLDGFEGGLPEYIDATMSAAKADIGTTWVKCKADKTLHPFTKNENFGFGDFELTDKEANKIKAVLLHLHTVFNL